MPTNTPEFEPGHDDETTDEPLDGRDSQPAVEGSSDDPRTLEAMDPLREAKRLADEASGHEARAGAEEIPATKDGIPDPDPDPNEGDEPDPETGPRFDAG